MIFEVGILLIINLKSMEVALKGNLYWFLFLGSNISLYSRSLVKMGATFGAE